MPNINGLDLAQTLRTDKTLADLKLIILTSTDLSLSAEIIKTAGINQIISKPVRQSQLYDCLMTLLDETMPACEQSTHLSPSKNASFDARILVVEDNLVNQMVAEEMLKNMGCQVGIAANGREGADRVLSDSYDLIFMDVQMPEMDGYEATAVIRVWEKTHHRAPIPIIALTANALEGYRETCLEAGMNDYLSKPFEQEQLLQILTRWLPKQTQRSTDSASLDHGQSQTQIALNPDSLDKIRALQRPRTPSLLKKVVDLYLEKAPGQIHMLHDAFDKNDSHCLCHAAHSLKSSSANLGAHGLAALCQDLEECGYQQQLDGVHELLSQVDAEFTRVRQALQAELAQVA
jgi:CheY-like chemotaxis protein